MQATIAEMEQKGELVLPITMVCPCLKESVLDTYKPTNIYLGELLGIKVVSVHEMVFTQIKR